MVAAYLALQWLAPAWALAGLLCSCTEANTGHVGRSLAAVAVAWFLVYRYASRCMMARGFQITWTAVFTLMASAPEVIEPCAIAAIAQ